MKPKDRPTPIDDGFATLEHKFSDEKPEPMLSPYYPILSAPLEKDEIGRLGKYRVLRLLGSGGMGMVFHAVDMQLGRPVALKVMKPNTSSKELSGERFTREARAMAAIKHDNLVTIYDIGQEGGTFYIAMELLLGESLEAHVERITQWELAEIIRVASELAAGLSAIHEHGLIHRDIKPANIWLEQQPSRARKEAGASEPLPDGRGSLPRVKILDFGLVRATNDDVAITGTGVIMGTPAFMAPEQIRGKMADVRSDLYSFGCVLYRICTGRLPHRADNSMAQLAAAVADEPEQARKLNPALPVPLADLVMQMLAKDPKARPASAKEVGQRLAKIEAALVSQRPDSATARLRPLDSAALDSELLAKKPSFLERHWHLVVLASGLIAFAAVVAAGVVVWLNIPPPERPDPPPQKGADGGAVAKVVPEKDRIYLKALKPIREVLFDIEKKKREGKKDGAEIKKDGFDFKTVKIDAKERPRSIFMHPLPDHDPQVAHQVYKLDGQYRVFAGEVTQNDSGEQKGGARSPMIFSIYCDENPQAKWQSKPVRFQTDRQPFSISVAGVKLLKLQVVADGEIKECHAVWLDPHLLK